MITIKENPSINDFFEVGNIVYKDIPQYVSLLKSDLKRFLSQSNPLFSKFGKGTYFVAYKNNKPVGRIVAHIHSASNELYQLKRGYFGYFDCIDEIDVAKALLDATSVFHKKNGMTEISGNFNLTAMQQMGVMTSGFENHHYTDQTYSAPHMAKLLTENGYTPSFPVSTFELDLKSFQPETLLKEKVSDLLKDDDYKFLNIKKKDFKDHMNSVRLVLNDGFANNPMFVPLTEEEFMFQAKDMMWIIDEKISSLVEYKGEPAGVVVCIPDLNGFLKETKSTFSLRTPYAFIKHKMNKDRAVIIFYSVGMKNHGKGLNTAMLYKVTTALKEQGYNSLGITWIADVNTASLRQMEKMGGKKLHGLHLFSKEILND